MNISRKNGCREKGLISTDFFHNFLSFQTFHTTHKLVLSTSTTLLLLPALFSCQTEQTVMMRISGQFRESHPLDVFIFNCEDPGHLDTYQHIENNASQEIFLRSQSGEKNVFICSDGQRTRYDWAEINSREGLDGIYIELKDERREHLCSTGEVRLTAGSDETHPVQMRRIASEIILQSIRCDFTGKPYEGRMIEDVQVYLINVNSSCSITADGDIVPLSIVNAGRADHDDIAGFKEPDLICQNMETYISTEISRVGMSFICYPNTSAKEGPGTPFTRLVIEGTIDGERFWWPIDINRNDGTENPGIHRNCRYIYDITIKRKGTSNPDEVMETETAEVLMKIRQWKEKDEHVIVY